MCIRFFFLQNLTVPVLSWVFDSVFKAEEKWEASRRECFSYMAIGILCLLKALPSLFSLSLTQEQRQSQSEGTKKMDKEGDKN